MIAIIGAGPVGNYVAYLLASNNIAVEVFEEHGEVGIPWQCTGITTASFEKIVELPPKLIINRLRKLKIVSRRHSVRMPIEEIVLDRVGLDKHWYEEAKKSGAKYHLNCRFERKEGKSVIVLDKKAGKEMMIQPDLLIGADGPSSKVSALINPKPARTFFGYQVRIKGEYDAECFETHFIDDHLFYWVVPESATVARIGTFCTSFDSRAWEAFLQRRCGKKAKGLIINAQPGKIPWYSGEKIIEKDGIRIVGDAAGQVKATTGGGLVPGFLAAKALARSIIKNTSYAKEVWEVHRQLSVSLYLRNILSRCSVEDYDALVRYLDQGRIKRLLYKIDRDHPIQLAWRAAVLEPRLLRFLPKLL